MPKFLRLKALWHVLRGRPLIYRVEFLDRVNISKRTYNLRILETAFLTGINFQAEPKEDAQAIQDEA